MFAFSVNNTHLHKSLSNTDEHDRHIVDPAGAGDEQVEESGRGDGTAKDPAIKSRPLMKGLYAGSLGENTGDNSLLNAYNQPHFPEPKAKLIKN